MIDNKFDYEITLENTSSYEISATVKDSGKFKIESDSIGKTLSGEKSYEISVKPLDDTSGYETSYYIVKVIKRGDPIQTPKPTQAPTQQGTANQNPQTGERGLMGMAVVLILSLFATIYLYKRNINGYNN